MTNTEQTNYRWFFGILQTNISNFFENSKGSTRYVSSRNNFVKAILCDSYVGVFTRFSLGVRGLRVDVSYLKGIKTFE